MTPASVHFLSTSGPDSLPPHRALLHFDADSHAMGAASPGPRRAGERARPRDQAVLLFQVVICWVTYLDSAFAFDIVVSSAVYCARMRASIAVRRSFRLSWSFWFDEQPATSDQKSLQPIQSVRKFLPDNGLALQERAPRA